MIATNVKDTFSILLEAGYLYKYKDIVWKPIEDESEDNSGNSSSDNGFLFDTSRKKSMQSSKYS